MRHVSRIPKSCIRSRSSTLIYESSRQLATLPKSCNDICLADKQLRSDLLALDGLCEYCRKREANTTDHFYSLVSGSSPTKYCNDLWNNIPCCSTCNSSKGNRNFKDWLQSNCRHSPKNDLTQKELAILVAKFERYDDVFLRNCMKKTIDQVWWDRFAGSIIDFLSAKQQEIDEYQQTCSISGRNLIYGNLGINTS